MYDFLSGDMFSVSTMTEVVKELKYVPSRLRELGVFGEPEPITTTAFNVEISAAGDVIVIPPSKRGGPGVTTRNPKDRGLILSVDHFQIDDAVYADEVQNTRETGTEAQMRTVASEIMKRVSNHRQSFELTAESLRMGALKGTITYSNGGTLDLISAFGLTANAEITFDCRTTSASARPIHKACTDLIRKTGERLGGVGFSELRIMCDNALFDAILYSEEVASTYRNTDAATFLRQSYVGPNRSVWGIFEYGGVVFENYRGTTAVNVGAGKGQVLPMGIPNLFKTVHAPADYEETVNTLGEELYVKQIPMRNGKGTDLEMQTNQLSFCRRPVVIQSVGFQV